MSAALWLPSLAQSEDTITATVTVQEIAVSVDPNSVDYGTVAFEGTKRSGTAASPYFTATIADNEDPDPLPPDINDDRSVNILDVAKMVDSWLTNVTDPSFDPRMDLNTDSDVNVLDVSPMFPVWLQTCTP